jgi:hypothetical protein
MGMGIDCSGNNLMGLGRCHFTSAIINRIAVVEAEGKNRHSLGGGRSETAGRQEGRRGRNCMSWLLVGDYLLIGNR